MGQGIGSYSGEITKGPTLFPFAHGIGLMGEAGPEAIMPLSRGPDGRLGVQAANSNAANNRTSVVIHNYGSPEAVRTWERPDGTLEVFLNEAVRRSVGAMESNMATGKYRPFNVTPGTKRS